LAIVVLAIVGLPVDFTAVSGLQLEVIGKKQGVISKADKLPKKKEKNSFRRFVGLFKKKKKQQSPSSPSEISEPESAMVKELFETTRFQSIVENMGTEEGKARVLSGSDNPSNKEGRLALIFGVIGRHVRDGAKNKNKAIPLLDMYSEILRTLGNNAKSYPRCFQKQAAKRADTTLLVLEKSVTLYCSLAKVPECGEIKSPMDHDVSSVQRITSNSVGYYCLDPPRGENYYLPEHDAEVLGRVHSILDLEEVVPLYEERRKEANQVTKIF